MEDVNALVLKGLRSALIFVYAVFILRKHTILFVLYLVPVGICATRRVSATSRVKRLDLRNKYCSAKPQTCFAFTSDALHLPKTSLNRGNHRVYDGETVKGGTAIGFYCCTRIFQLTYYRILYVAMAVKYF